MKQKKQRIDNPIVTFDRVWRRAERIVATLAFVLVLGTLGVVSIHVLA